jgi:hypothetical protein
MTTMSEDPARSAEATLNAWRAAERARDAHPLGSPEWLQADHGVDELRHAYHESFRRAVGDREAAPRTEAR